MGMVLVAIQPRVNRTGGLFLFQITFAHCIVTVPYFFVPPPQVNSLLVMGNGVFPLPYIFVAVCNVEMGPFIPRVYCNVSIQQTDVPFKLILFATPITDIVNPKGVQMPYCARGRVAIIFVRRTNTGRTDCGAQESDVFVREMGISLVYGVHIGR